MKERAGRECFMLELSHLSKQYGSTLALDDCSFAVERGRVLGFLGRNGAGKTTTMRSIFGLVDLEGGRIAWNGEPVGRETRFHFGYMPEERGLYPRMTVADQLVYFGRLRRLDAATSRAEAERWMDRLDILDRRDSPVDSLSHGNQQKVQLAVALVGDPELLVLDEPFSGLDPIAVSVLSAVIRERADQGVAVVFSSHQLNLVGDVCDDIAVITRGHVVLQGDLDELRRTAETRVLEVRLKGPPEGAWAAGLARQLSHSRLEAEDGDYARLNVDASTQLDEIVAALFSRGIDVSELHLEPPTLQQLFREAIGEAA
jgi:ABC-2 type transport system ATP-binding protein